MSGIYTDVQARLSNALESFNRLHTVVNKVKLTEETITYQGNRISSLESSLKESQDELEKSEEAVKSVSETLVGTTHSLAQTTRELDELKRENASIQMKHDNLVEREKQLRVEVEQQTTAWEKASGEAQQLREEIERLKADMSTAASFANQTLAEKERRIETLEREKADMETKHQAFVDEIMRTLQEERENIACRKTETDRLRRLLEEQVAKCKKFDEQHRQARSEAENAQCARNKAMDIVTVANEQMEQVRRMCRVLEDEMAEERRKWEEEASRTRSLLAVAEAEINRLKSVVAGKEGELERTLQGTKILRDTASANDFMASHIYQLRISAANYALRHRKQREESANRRSNELGMQLKAELTGRVKAEERSSMSELRVRQLEEELIRAMSRFEEKHQAMITMERQKDEAIALTQKEKDRVIAIMREEKDQVANLMQRDIDLKEDEIRHLRSLPLPTSADMDEHMKMLEARTRKAEGRLRDAVEESLDLRERAEYSEELELVLEETRRVLKTVETRLRDVIDENAELRRRQHIW